MDQFNANKPRRLWENREIFTGSAYGVIVVTGPTKTLVPAAVMGLVPRDRGAESELFLDCASLTSFHNFGEPVNNKHQIQRTQSHLMDSITGIK